MADQSTDTPVLDLLTEMTADSIRATGLDEQTLMLVRFAALVAVDAPPASYLMNMAAGREVGLTAEDAQDVLTAVAPIVGTSRIVSATGKMARALGLAIAMTEDDESEE
jgi:alkylhydroperoxidase/carboxymuconolactone decarboxylase family protein YurZ